MFTTARDAAKLLPSDLAKLLRVNRCTVSFWYSGRCAPHVQLREKVNKVLDAIGRAVEAGDLPVPHGVRHRERGLYIEKAVVKHLLAKTKQAA